MALRLHRLRPSPPRCGTPFVRPMRRGEGTRRRAHAGARTHAKVQTQAGLPLLIHPATPGGRFGTDMAALSMPDGDSLRTALPSDRPRRVWRDAAHSGTRISSTSICVPCCIRRTGCANVQPCAAGRNSARTQTPPEKPLRHSVLLEPSHEHAPDCALRAQIPRSPAPATDRPRTTGLCRETYVRSPVPASRVAWAQGRQRGDGARSSRWAISLRPEHPPSNAASA